MLVVVDEFSRECLAIQVARGLTSDDVLAVLAELFVEKGVPPEHIRSGNGPEFVAAAVRAWLARPARRRDLVHRARQPGGEWLLRVVQRQAPGRAAGSGGLPQLTGGAGPDRCKAKPWTGGGTTTPSVRTRRSATDHRRPRRCRGRRGCHPARPLATAPMSCIANAAPGPARRGRSRLRPLGVLVGPVTAKVCRSAKREKVRQRGLGVARLLTEPAFGKELGPKPVI